MFITINQMKKKKWQEQDITKSIKFENEIWN